MQVSRHYIEGFTKIKELYELITKRKPDIHKDQIVQPFATDVGTMASDGDVTNIDGWDAQLEYTYEPLNQWGASSQLKSGIIEAEKKFKMLHLFSVVLFISQLFGSIFIVFVYFY